MSYGSFFLWPANEEGDLINPPFTSPSVAPPIFDPTAVDIYFGVPSSSPKPLPKDQLDLEERISSVLRSLRILYAPTSAGATADQKARFREYYTRLFRLGQLGLEGDDVSTDLATAALNTVTANLIDDEAGRVKNKHLKLLAKDGSVLAIPFAVAYLIFRGVGASEQTAAASAAQAASASASHASAAAASAIAASGVNASILNIDPFLFANFMLLWIGCFLGVWLSYGIRTTTFTLSDLTITDADRLVPTIRLLFAGSLTMLLGIIFVIPIVSVNIGSIPLTEIAPTKGSTHNSSMLAFLVGSFCGVSELLLPTAIAKRASDFMGSIK